MFGNRIRDLREDNDLTQEQLSRYLHITRSALANYENEFREPPYTVLIQIADFFNVSLDYLLCRTNKLIPYSKLYTGEERLK
jgi:transcriptional regulator with XRE-family HTH domain